jgi:hypothetical protein
MEQGFFAKLQWACVQSPRWHVHIALTHVWRVLDRWCTGQKYQEPK